MISHLKVVLNELMAYQTINTLYYSGVFIISLILIVILLNNWFEFRRMRVVMSIKQLLITVITIISLSMEPIINSYGWGYQTTIDGVRVLITPSVIISLIGLIICGFANCRINHRIWRTEFPTRPYPNDLRG